LEARGRFIDNEDFGEYDCDSNAPDISDDCILRQAVRIVRQRWESNFWRSRYDMIAHNCQDFVREVVNEYNRLLQEENECKGECGLKTKEECDNRCNKKDK